MKTTNNIVATKEMAKYCFDVIRYKLKDLKKMPKFISSIAKKEVPLFVTFDKLNEKNKYELRGCIGTFKPHELEDGLEKYAIEAAFKDTRFTPINLDELPKLKCTVSLLVNFEKGENLKDWEIGKHGIKIEFIHPDWGINRSATYLPEVAKEQGWNKEKTLEMLYKKAGYSGYLSKRLFDNTILLRYESVKAELTYTDYITM